nr:O-fucosyltransferase 31-like [Ipomoea batatas]
MNNLEDPAAPPQSSLCSKVDHKPPVAATQSALSSRRENSVGGELRLLVASGRRAPVATKNLASGEQIWDGDVLGEQISAEKRARVPKGNNENGKEKEGRRDLESVTALLSFYFYDGFFFAVWTLDDQFELWVPLSNQGWNPYYSESGVVSSLPEKSERYIQVFLDGGLINQRMGLAIHKMIATLDDPFTWFLESEKFNSWRVWFSSTESMGIYDVAGLLQ